MKSSSWKSSARWRNLLYGAQLLNESIVKNDQPRYSVDLALIYLGNLKEVFPKELDPTDDFEGYSVREFAKALEQVLSRVRDNDLLRKPSTSRS